MKIYSRHGNSTPENRTAKIHRTRQPLFSILFLFFGVLFILSVVAISKYLIEREQEKQSFSELATTATLEQQIIESADPDNMEIEPQYTEYAALYEENSDFVGWLHIDNTSVDYPVMFTPDEPEYYLHRAFDKTDSQSGTPFISKGSTIDSDFYIIYGHNMKNDTMFGTLDCYAKKEFWEENPLISFTTVTEERKYEIFAALETYVLYQDETGYRYYFQVGNLTEGAFDELIGWLQQNALYDTGITPEYGEQIVVLSTCSYHTDNGRFVIAARRVDNAE